MSLTPPIDLKLDDEKAERVRRSHAQSIAELQVIPFAKGVVIQGVTLADATTTTVSHGLGRLPIWCSPSPPRNATSTGRIEEVRSSSVDRTKYIQLKATGWGATITVDVAVA